MSCESRDKVFHPYVQSTLDIDVSLHRGIPLGRPLDQEMMRNVSHWMAPLLDLGGVDTLEGSITAQRFLGRLKEERDILPFSTLPTLTTHTALTKVAAVTEDGTFMVQERCSMDSEK